MCGLVGVAAFERAGLFNSHIDSFQDLLVADAVRGSHGTGIFSVNAKGRRSTLKIAGHPYNLFQCKGYGNLTSVSATPYVKVLAGHNRYATTGDHNTTNAHPFYHQNITMMHNGTLTRRDKLPVRKLLGAEAPFVVDSDHFTYAVSEIGVADAVANLEGAYAIVYYDSYKKTLNFARNYQRPLWFAKSVKDNLLLWSSEPELLAWVKRRNNISGDLTISEVPVNTLFSFSIKEHSLDEEETKLPVTGSKIISVYQGGYSPPQYKQSAMYDDDYGDFGFGYEVNKSKKSEEKPEVKIEPPEDSKIPAQSFTDNVIALPDKSKKEQSMGSDITRIPFVMLGHNTKLKVGDTVRFAPYDKKLIDMAKERYQIIGTKDDAPRECRFLSYVSGTELADIFLDEEELEGTVKEIVKICRNGTTIISIYVPDADQILVSQSRKVH